jgi:hypothetical protein
VFLDHLEWSLLARICGDEPRRIFPAVDDPGRSDRPLPAFLSVHRQPAVNNIVLACTDLSTTDDLPAFGNVSKGFYQALGILAREKM